MINKKNKKQKYWYEFTIIECPLCGGVETTKERIYNKPKPKNLEDQYHYIESYDYCDAL